MKLRNAHFIKPMYAANTVLATVCRERWLGAHVRLAVWWVSSVGRRERPRGAQQFRGGILLLTTGYSYHNRLKRLQQQNHNQQKCKKMEIKKGKHVKLVCSLEVGQTIRIFGWGYKFDGKYFKIQGIKQHDNCESGFLVKIDGYENWLDSNWITPTKESEQSTKPPQ